MTLAATTFSIMLTFGTSAVIEHRKLNAEKREMVLMVMYDMRESLKDIEQIDEDLKDFFEIQVDVVAHPDKLSQSYIGMASRIPMARYSMTTETIFRSNIETIRTIGNILFVEAVSSFYDLREKYKAIVIEDFQNQPNSLLFFLRPCGISIRPVSFFTAKLFSVR